MTISVLGPEGTFCDNAYLMYKSTCIDKVSDLEAVYFNTIDDVFEGAESSCELGIAPIENTLDGYVQRTLDLLLERDVYIIDENVVPVQFSVVGNVSSVEDIKELYVQFKANGQCRKFINSLSNAKIITTESNMESYYSIEGKTGAAAIVPAHIAEREKKNKHRLIIENVTDAEKNHTRFVVLKKGNLNIDNAIKKCVQDDKTEQFTGKDYERVRIPAYVMPKTERPGILYEILKSFFDNSINLISIMSRPTKQEMGTYNFYIEIDGPKSQLMVILKALKNISKDNDIKILGIYGE